MTWVAGVDGCRAGWFRVCREIGSGKLRFDVVPSAADLVRRSPIPSVIALDIPIGLPESGSRECDVDARKRLGPRRSSVFPAPVRAAVVASSQAEASDLTAAIDGRRVGAQAFGIYPKIRSVDEALAADPALRAAAREVHPEVSFWCWNARVPMHHSKKTAQGAAERIALAEQWLGVDLVGRARNGFTKRELADDDVLDAIACLWTAHRIAEGAAETLPGSPPRDREGLPMEIVY